MIREDLPREAGKNGEYIIMYCPWCEHEQKELGYKVHAWTIIECDKCHKTAVAAVWGYDKI